MSKSIDMSESYSKPKVGRFLRHGVLYKPVAKVNGKGQISTPSAPKPRSRC